MRARGAFSLCCWPCIFPAALQSCVQAAEQLPVAPSRLCLCSGVPGPPRPTACPSACLGCRDYVAGGCSICTFLQGLSLPLPLVPRRAAPPGPRGAQSRAGKPPRAEGPAVSWGNRVLLGAAKCCTVTCLGLEGDSRTGGQQVAQWGWTQSQKPQQSTQCSAAADTLPALGAGLCGHSSVRVTAGRGDTQQNSVHRHPAFWAASSQPDGGGWHWELSPSLPGWPGSCGGPGLCCGAQFSCGASAALQPLAVLTQSSDPIASLQAGAGPGPSGLGCWGSPSSCSPSSWLPGSGRVERPVHAAGIAQGQRWAVCAGALGRTGGMEPAPEAMGPTRPSAALSSGDVTPHSQGCPGMGLCRVRLYHPLTFPRKDKQRDLLPPCAGGFPRSLLTCAALL